jgi:hypothetical protein
MAAEPRTCTGPRPEVIDKFNVAAPRPVTTMFGGREGKPVRIRPGLVAGLALASAIGTALPTAADEGAERLIVRVIGPGELKADGGSLPPLVQVHGKGGDLLNSEGAPLSRAGFVRMVSDPARAPKGRDGRAVFVIDLVDKQTPLAAVASLIDSIRSTLPAEARVTLLVRFELK